MNNKILVTVHYWIEDEKEVFWEKDTGYLNQQVDEALQTQFPKQVKLPQKLCAKRYSLIHRPVDYPNANLIECPICKRFITDTTKPEPIPGIDAAEELKGVMMCSSCAWEQSFNIKKHKLIPGKPPIPKGARIIREDISE